MTIATKLATLLVGRFAGQDKYGNRYYYRLRNGQRDKRWVMYKGEAEGSKVPAQWNAWLHHTISEIPDTKEKKYPWIKDHQANLSGTASAYRPPLRKTGQRQKATGDYEAWKP